jgi:hypothetical protein
MAMDPLDTTSVEAFDMSSFLAASDGGDLDSDTLDLCKQMADFIHQTGVLVVRDPRVSTADNDSFLEMMSRYYCQPTEVRRDELAQQAHASRSSELVNPSRLNLTHDAAHAPVRPAPRCNGEQVLMEDARPEVFYQVGVTPENTETALLAHDRALQQQVSTMPPEHRPLQPSVPDPKWRFFWRMGERPDESETEFADLNAPPVVPASFEGEWAATMDGWGSLLLRACTTVAEMLAIGQHTVLPPRAPGLSSTVSPPLAVDPLPLA